MRRVDPFVDDDLTRACRVEAEAEREPDPEGDHREQLAEVADDVADAEIAGPVRGVEEVRRLAGEQHPAAGDEHRQEAEQEDAWERRGQPHFVQPPRIWESAMASPAAAIRP